MPRRKTARAPQSAIPNEIIIEHAGDVLVFMLNNPEHGNQVAAVMFEELDSSISQSHLPENMALVDVAKK
jgi:hypothetical protein